MGEPSLEKVPPHPFQEHLSACLRAKAFARPPVLMQAPAELGPMSQFALASLVSLDITLSTLHFSLPLRCHSERSRQLSIVGGENPTLGRARSGISQAQVTMGPISLSQWGRGYECGRTFFGAMREVLCGETFFGEGSPTPPRGTFKCLVRGLNRS